MKKNVNTITIINIVSTFILQGIVLITTPIFTRLLGAEQYGLYSLFNSWVLILSCVMGLGMGSSIGTGMYTFRNEYIKFRNSVLLMSTFICFAELLVLYLLRNGISYFIGFDSFIVMLIGICAFGHYIVNFAQLCFTYEKRALLNLILSISVSFGGVILSIYCIIQFTDETKYIGRILGVTIVYFFAALIVWILLYLKKLSKPNIGYLKYSLMLGVPIVFHTLSQNILSQSDRVMMQMFSVSASDIGIYSLFYTLSSVLSTILNSLNNSWCPFYYDDVSEAKWGQINEKSKHYVELFTVVCVGFLLLSREVSYIMSDRSYWGRINIIPILAIAVYFTFMYQHPVNFEFYHKKTYIIACGTIGAGILNIVLNALLIPGFGMYGAAFATALSYFMLFIVHYLIVKNMKDCPFCLNMQIFVPGLFAMFLGTVLFYVLAPWWYMRWGLGALLGCLELYRIYKRKSIF